MRIVRQWRLGLVGWGNSGGDELEGGKVLSSENLAVSRFEQSRVVVGFPTIVDSPACGDSLQWGEPAMFALPSTHEKHAFANILALVLAAEVASTLAARLARMANARTHAADVVLATQGAYRPQNTGSSLHGRASA